MPTEFAIPSMSADPSTKTITRCDLCKRCYDTVKKAINNNVIKNAAAGSVGWLVQTVQAALGAHTPLPVFASAVATGVLNYIRNNGFTEPAFKACANLGFCP